MTIPAERIIVADRDHRRAAGRWARVGYRLVDILLVLLGAYLAYALRHGLDLVHALLGLRNPVLPTGPLLTDYAALLLVYTSLVVLLCESHGLYGTPRGRLWLDEAWAVFKAVSLAVLLVMLFVYLLKMHQVSRYVVLATWGLNVATLAGWRYLKRRAVERAVARGYGVRNVLIVGAGKIGRKLADTLEKHGHLGLAVRGFLDDRANGDRVLGSTRDLERVVRLHFIDEVIITIPSERDLVRRVAAEARAQGADVRVVPDLFDGVASFINPTITLVGDLPVMELHRQPIPEMGLLTKRVMDIAGALAGLALTGPLMALIAIAIRLDYPGAPVLYRSRRIGKKGRVFDCYKFRTMVPEADTLKEEMGHLNERRGPMFKITNDPRVTRLGRFLRKYSLDELPQFFNVLKGEMSLVGPRPPTVDEVAKYEAYKLGYYRRLDVKPGMTSLWAVQAQREPDFERAFELDLFYIENWSLWLDLKILLMTLGVVVRGVGR